MRRAYGIEDKKVRQAEILAAARRLFMDMSGELPSVASIAAAAGLAKGTVYLYFGTKEAIFADLLLAGWTEVLKEVAEVFDAPAYGDAQMSDFVTRYTGYLKSHPELLRLDALGHEIERNLEPATLRAFKRDLNERLASAGIAMERALGLPSTRGTQVLMRIYAFTRGLWLTLGNGTGLAAEEASTSGADFASELADALGEYWRGILAAPVA